jgi:hypothetical protein
LFFADYSRKPERASQEKIFLIKEFLLPLSLLTFKEILWNSFCQSIKFYCGCNYRREREKIVDIKRTFAMLSRRERNKNENCMRSNKFYWSFSRKWLWISLVVTQPKNHVEKKYASSILTYCMPFPTENECESYLNKNKFIFFCFWLVFMEVHFFGHCCQHHIIWGYKSSWLSLWCKYLKCELKKVCDLTTCDWQRFFSYLLKIYVADLCSDFMMLFEFFKYVTKII